MRPEAWGVCIDPSGKRTGLALVTAPVLGEFPNGGVKLDYSRRRIEHIAAGGRKTGVAFGELAREAIAERVPLDARLFWAVEKPPPEKAGGKYAPTAARAWWIDWITLWHAEREAALRVTQHRRPALLEPDPGTWRRPQGLATSCPDRTLSLSQRSAWLKRQSVAAADLEIQRHGSEEVRRLWVAAATEGRPKAGNHDVAEAVMIARWAMTSVASVGAWVPPGGGVELFKLSALPREDLTAET